jgi:hypothetical protein
VLLAPCEEEKEGLLAGVCVRRVGREGERVCALLFSLSLFLQRKGVVVDRRFVERENEN